MNKQRENVYTLRRELLEGTIKIDEDEVVDTRGYLMALAEDLARRPGRDARRQRRRIREEWDLDALRAARPSCSASMPDDVDALDARRDDARRDGRRDLRAGDRRSYEEKEQVLPDPSLLRRVERDIMLQIVDAQWKDHLYSLDHLKEGIGLRGYGQRDPLVEYKKKASTLFQAMKDRIDEEMVRYLWRLRPVDRATSGAAAPPPAAASGAAASRRR